MKQVVSCLPLWVVDRLSCVVGYRSECRGWVNVGVTLPFLHWYDGSPYSHRWGECVISQCTLCQPMEGEGVNGNSSILYKALPGVCGCGSYIQSQGYMTNHSSFPPPCLNVNWWSPQLMIQRQCSSFKRVSKPSGVILLQGIDYIIMNKIKDKEKSSSPVGQFYFY